MGRDLLWKTPNENASLERLHPWDFLSGTPTGSLVVSLLSGGLALLDHRLICRTPFGVLRLDQMRIKVSFPRGLLHRLIPGASSEACPLDPVRGHRY